MILQHKRTLLSLVLGWISLLFGTSHHRNLLLVNGMVVKTRVELFFKTPSELKDRVRFLQSHGVQAFNLVNKNTKEPIVHWVDAIRQEFPEANVCAHYSLKYNKAPRQRDPSAHAARWINFVNVCQANEILVINGSGDKNLEWNTVTALQSLKEESESIRATIAVAYNPYFPEQEQQRLENERLQQKLATGVVDKIYLQFGTDTKKLAQALRWIEETNKEKPLQVAGSMFLPTAKLIAQQKFRPWNGVFLSPKFLSGPESAQDVVHEMMRIYNQHSVEVLWEAPGIRTENDLNVTQQLLASQSKNGQRGAITSTNVSSKQESFKQQQQQAPPSETSSKSNKRPKLSRSKEPCIVLFGSHDVRLGDNRAVELAAQNHQKVIPVFLWTQQGPWGVTGALQVVLQEALQSLESSLEKVGLRLVCRNCQDDNGCQGLVDIAQSTGAKVVYWNREHTTESRKVEALRAKELQQVGVRVEDTQSSLLYDPELIELDSGFHGGHWGTLMPFLRSCVKKFGQPPRPVQPHETLRLLEDTQEPEWPKHVRVKDLKIAIVRGKDKWDKPIRERFPMTESAAEQLLDEFFSKGLGKYEKERSRADKEFATSKLSPHLRIGTMSPNQLYWRTKDSGMNEDLLKTFSRRLVWRDLAYYHLKCFPEMRNRSIRRHYEKSGWVTGEEEQRRLRAWQRGETGFPIVDAGMRELYRTGWMTQSVRMVVASFLVEYLRVTWVKGCEWFHYTLVDADSAINAMMWQNAGKSGIDQWNFILSPVTASQDPSGDYVRQWVPELASLPTIALVHRPWEAPDYVLEEAGVVLGETYPERIVVDLQTERSLSVKSTLEMRRQSQEWNNDRGYDLIELPNGKKTVVFTKKEYRIDPEGNKIVDKALLKPDVPKKKRPATRRGSRKRNPVKSS